MQAVAVIVIGLAALAYLAQRLYKSFSSDSCAGNGCAKCAAVDAEKILKQIQVKSH